MKLRVVEIRMKFGISARSIFMLDFSFGKFGIEANVYFASIACSASSPTAFDVACKLNEK